MTCMDHLSVCYCFVVVIFSLFIYVLSDFNSFVDFCLFDRLIDLPVYLPVYLYKFMYSYMYMFICFVRWSQRIHSWRHR